MSIYKSIAIDNGGATTGYDPVLTVPANAAEGDRMTVIVQTSDNDPSIAPTPPATETWTLESSGNMPIDGTAAASPSAVWVYGKDVSADDEANAGTKTYTWTFAGSEEQCGFLVLTGPANFGQFAKNELTGTRTTIDAPSVTTTVANELVYHCALKDGGVLFTGVPSGDATRAHEIFGDTGGAGACMGVVEQEYVSPGATGTKAFTHATEESNGYTFSLVPAAGIGSVTPDEFDMDTASVTIAGTNFGASQGTGTVYISDATTLAGSVNEVEVANGINTWSDTSINLDLTGLNATELSNLHTLGPGTRYVIVVNNATDEYGSPAVALHRPQALQMSLGAGTPGATTARLTAPAGKTTGDFVAGRFEEVSNPASVVDITVDDYTEMVWSIEAKLESREVSYDFRVTKNGVVVDAYTVTPQVIIIAGAAYLIAGDVTVNSTIAAALSYNQNPELSGDVTVTPSVAATLTYNQNPIIDGDVSVIPTVASAMSYTVNPVVVGDITVDVSVASALDYTINANIEGDTTVTSNIAAAMDFTVDSAIDGDVTVASNILATTVYTQKPAIGGDVIVTPAIAATMEYTLNASIAGDVTVNSTVAAILDYTSGYGVAGDVIVNTSIASGMEYTLNTSIDGNVTVLSTIASAMAYTINPAIDGDITITPNIAAALEYATGAALIGDATVDVSIASALDYTFNAIIEGDVTVTPAVSSLMNYIQQDGIVGDVTIESIIASGFDYTLTASIYGDVTVGPTIASALDYTQNPEIIGDVSVGSTVSSLLAYNQNLVIDGDVTIEATIASTMDFVGVYGITGDVTVDANIAAVMEYSAIAAISGDVTVNTTIDSGMVYNQHVQIDGDTTATLTVGAGLQYVPSGALSANFYVGRQMIVSRNDTSAPLWLAVDNTGGIPGLTVSVQIRDGSTVNSYLDFSDSTFKTVGWVQKSLVLNDIGGGHYNSSLDLTEIANLPNTNHLALEYDIQGAVVGVANGVLSFNLAREQDVENTAYKGEVAVDAGSIYAGTEHPIGTHRCPVNNLADAKAIAANRGIEGLAIHDEFTLEATDVVDNLHLKGDHSTLSKVTAISGVSTADVVFEDLTIVGALNGSSSFEHCDIFDITGIGCTTSNSHFDHCVLFAENIVINPINNKIITIVDCSSGIAGVSTPTLDVNGTIGNIIIHRYVGGMVIKNITSAISLTIDTLGGNITIDSSCTVGTIVFRGATRFTDNSGPGCTVIDQTTPALVWAQSEALTEEKFIGLS